MFNRNSAFAYFMLFGVLASSESQAAQRIHFDELPALVASKNKHVQAAVVNKDAVHAREGHLARSVLPRVDGRIGAEKFRAEGAIYPVQGFAGVEARVNVFRGLRDSREEQRREALSEVAGATEKEASVEELKKTRLVYWDILFQREMADLIRRALVENDKYVAAAEQRVRAGLATDTDLLEFRMNRIQLEQDRVRFTLAVSAGERSLAVLLGFPQDTALELDPRIPHDHEAAIRELREAQLDPATHWSILTLKGQEKAADLERAVAKDWWAPTVDVYGGYALPTFREKDYPTAFLRTEVYGGVKLSVPLFDGLEGVTESRSKTLEARALSLRAEQSASELGARMELIRSRLKILHELLMSSESSLPVGEKYLGQTLSEYKRGVKNSPDVLGASQKALELSRRVVEFRKEYQDGRTELLALLGR